MVFGSVINEAYLRNQTTVPVFYRGNKIWVRVLVRNNYITSALDTKHGSFPSLCIGDNHRTVLECTITHLRIIVLDNTRENPKGVRTLTLFNVNSSIDDG